MKRFTNSQDKGDLSKAAIMLCLMKKGYKILDTVGENHRFDLVIYNDDLKFSRIQCKTGKIKNGVIYITTCSVVKNFKTGKYEKRSYSGQIDYFCVYCPDNDKCYMLKSDGINTSLKLRINPKLKKGVEPFWAKDYEM